MSTFSIWRCPLQVQLKLIRRGTVCFPGEQCREMDLLIAGDRIGMVEEGIEPPKGLDVAIFDAANSYVIPGLIDLHVHLIGGGGESGPSSLIPEISLPTLTTAAITTVVGVLGTDAIARTPEALLTKVKGLRKEGLSPYMYTGAYHFPSPTITGSVTRDIALIDEIIGVKIAISDHRCSQPTLHELARLASEARVGGMLGGKPGLVHVHVGRGKEGLGPIFSVIKETEVPILQFLPTHISRNSSLLEQGIEFVERGGAIDLTAPSDPEKAIRIVRTLLENRVDLSRITFSSDGNGSKPRFDLEGRLVEMGVGEVSVLIRTLRHLVRSKTLPLPQALMLFTSNPAARLGLHKKKGCIRPGADADLVLLDEDLHVDKVFARGRLLVDRGEPVAKGELE